MRSLTLQLLRANRDLTPHIFDNYANRGLAPSIMHLRRLLPELLATISSVRFCMDGLDEYPESDQRAIIQELLSLSKSSSGHFRILFSSREGIQIDRAMRGRPTISLKDEYTDVEKDIERYVHGNLEELEVLFPAGLIRNIQNRMVSKAKGQSHRRSIVISSLFRRHVPVGTACYAGAQRMSQRARTGRGGRQAAGWFGPSVSMLISRILSRLILYSYGRILDRVMNVLSRQASEKAIRTLEWIACSFRTMKEYEIQDGIVFHGAETMLDENTKLTSGFLDLCKPLIEHGSNDTIDFVHYSAKE